MTEEEKRLHRCCFSGHRPEKLRRSEEEIRRWLSDHIDEAIAEGYRTFITGMAMGVDIWAGQIVVEKRRSNPDIHLIAAIPYERFPARWSSPWKKQYDELLGQADLVKIMCRTFDAEAFRKRNDWMVDHSGKLIAYFNGETGGTQSMIDYARSQRVKVVIGGVGNYD